VSMQVVAHQSFPALITKGAAGYGKGVRQKLLDVVVQKFQVDLHPSGFQSFGLRVNRRIAYMRREVELHCAEVWKIATQLRHDLLPYKPTDRDLAFLSVCQWNVLLRAVGRRELYPLPSLVQPDPEN